MSRKTPQKKLVVIGLGLIGASLAAAVKQHAFVADSDAPDAQTPVSSIPEYEVIGIVRRQQTAEIALAEQLVDRVFLSLADIAPELQQGDIVCIAVPTLSVPSVLHEINTHLSPEVTITDGASVKGSVLQAVRDCYGEIPSQVVLGHPIAGSEKSGVTAANPALYINHRVILTPTPETGAAHQQRVQQLWESVGAEVLTLSVDEHDTVLAATSHLPHVIAYSLVDTLANDADNEHIFRYAAGGFRDFTRIASSDPQMWHDIMCANKTAILSALDLFQHNLAQLREAIESDDSEALFHTFNRAKAARDHFTALAISSPTSPTTTHHS